MKHVHDQKILMVSRLLLVAVLREQKLSDPAACNDLLAQDKDPLANMPDMPSKSVSLRALNLEPPNGHLLARLRTSTRSLWANMKRSIIAHFPINGHFRLA